MDGDFSEDQVPGLVEKVNGLLMTEVTPRWMDKIAIKATALGAKVAGLPVASGLIDLGSVIRDAYQKNERVVSDEIDKEFKRLEARIEKEGGVQLIESEVLPRLKVMQETLTGIGFDPHEEFVRAKVRFGIRSTFDKIEQLDLMHATQTLNQMTSVEHDAIFVLSELDRAYHSKIIEALVQDLMLEGREITKQQADSILGRLKLIGLLDTVRDRANRKEHFYTLTTVAKKLLLWLRSDPETL